MKVLLALTTLLAVGFVACEPDEPIEWLHREDSIIVQLRTAGGDSFTWTSDRERLPAFTLYGDGMLIVSKTDEEGCGRSAGKPCSAVLLESRLSEGDIQELIDFIDGTGFFAFQYDQPTPPVSGVPTAYIYVNTKLAANAVRWSGWGGDLPDGAEWKEFRKLRSIRERIQQLHADAIARPTPFAPEEGVLHIVPLVATDFIDVPLWPYPDIALPANAPENDVTEVRLSAAQLASMALEHPNETMCWTQVQSSGRLYDVCYRPALPFEENFPEFDEAS